MEWQELFKDHGEEVVRLHIWDWHTPITLENLYQAFKARYEAENAPAEKKGV